MKNLLVVLSSLALVATLSGCQSEIERIETQAKIVQACKDNGGQWYNSGNGHGPLCHFDTRYDDIFKDK
jgi:hypothetical protein